VEFDLRNDVCGSRLPFNHARPAFAYSHTVGRIRRFQNVHTCPRYYYSLSQLGGHGWTKIEKSEDERLEAFWKDNHELLTQTTKSLATRSQQLRLPTAGGLIENAVMRTNRDFDTLILK